MNLRKAENYTVGLDLGTSSVGWAVIDEDGKLYHFRGQPTWGSRLFPSADTAASTRLKRGQRRRYERRRQRIDALQSFFLQEMEKVDEDFFVRLRQARLLKEDKDESIREYRWPLFNGSEFTEAEYYNKYPTIYHLRRYLMTASEKADLRLIYLALHNIVKYRGNFLYEDEGESLKASNANAAASAVELCAALQDYLRELPEAGEEVDCNAEAVEKALDERGVSRGNRVEALIAAFSAQGKDAQSRCKYACRACVGYKVDFSKLIDGLEDAEGASFSLSEEEKAQSFVDEICPDDARRLFDALRAAYSSFVLSGILQGATSISDAMVRIYELHQSDLKTLKSLFRDYLTHDQYNEFFRGEEAGHGRYDINKLVKGSYTSYVIGERGANKKGTSHEELIKKIRELCDSNPAIREDERYKEISERLESGDESDFLMKQKTRSNGAIPYQLHLEEMDAIIRVQGEFYPFLLKSRESIEKLVSSRIPYYVGPLNAGHDPKNSYPGNPVDQTRKFAWSVRRPGMERAEAFPWNVDEVIDTDKTADLFIRRMTGTCSYLYGEPVLPRHSLLYEEFCVLNELNGAKWCFKGGKPRRFDHVDKERIVQELFRGRKSANVSYSLVQKWLLEDKEHGAVDAEVSGGQGETGFESKLSTYHDFCKLFGVNSLDDAPLSLDEIEEIVLWSTVFEDRAILRRKLLEKYGPEGDGRLTTDQIKRIVNKRYAGWGKLSKKLLMEVRVPASVPSGFVSIMDVLRYGNPNEHLHQLVLMEVLADRDLGFGAAIDEVNNQRFEKHGQTLTIDDMQGSPANRRSVNQAMRILDEIIGIAGKPPERICIEVTRDDNWQEKGKRTRARYVRLKDALNAFKADARLFEELEDWKDNLDDDRLLLYFEQQGKCMYSSEALDINQLSSYQIDHILPQSYIKDDSIDNRVLVKSRMNQRKLNSLLLDDSIIDARFGWWRALRDAGLMSGKKFERLTCRNLSERQVQGFINRQLVETSQIVKFVRQMCERKYKNAEVVSVRANVSHGVRDNLDLVKCRELNNYHHAHDAFIACQVADFVGRCYPSWQDGVDVRAIMKRVNGLKGRSGFIADSMTESVRVDQKTGEIIWDKDERNAYMKKALGYRSCFISRMTEIATSAFWDETVYSPRDERNGRSLFVPLKSSELGRNREGYLDPKKYGGVNSVKQAYWFIFAAKDKKGKYKYFFEGVPIHLVGQVGDGLQQYADEIAATAKCGKAVILRERVPLRQKFELNGTPYYLYGNGEIRTAVELLGDSLMVWELFNEPELLDASQLIEMYEWLSRAVYVVFPDVARLFSSPKLRAAFLSLGHDEMVSQLKEIVKKLNGDSQKLDVSLLGGSKTGGNIRKSIAKELPSITWIDQSVTGMFEMRTTFEDLCRGL